MSLARAREDYRKADTRRKIRLGGLVIKAGLDAESEAVIFGVLLDAVANLQGPDGNNERTRLQEVGSRALTTGDDQP